jgi:hypothetical protein
MKIPIAASLLAWVLASSAAAHELESNRATLVLRDSQHLSLTFFLDYPRVLHQVLAPQQPLKEFVLMYSAMNPAQLQSQLLEAQRKLQSGIAVTLHNGKAVALTHWVWPEARAVQTVLQQRAMQAVVAPADHAHAATMEIRAQASSSSTKDFNMITLQLPPQFQQVLVVSYQPKQVLMKPGIPSPAIAF